MECQISAALQASLATAVRAAEDAAPPVTVGSGEQHPAENVPVSGNLDLLMDVELGVTLRFGSRNMLLRDILELGAGAVVELDRRVEEPVELLLDGRLIARGEIVVVDGNYGLRVLDVAAPRMEQGISQGSGR
jgi:flagellar motor switch protein FliN/FliY